MTQSSRPQAGNVTVNPSYIDAGPWSRDEWAQKLIIEWVGDAVDTRGPFAKYLNRLEVTNPAGVTIQVDTGAGYCNGSLLNNDVAVSFTPNTPAIASRTDKVVLVENNTNTAYTGAISGVVLDFPTDLTDYSGLYSVPPYSCRLAILRGDPVTGNPTALIQTANYWMIELARFNVTNVPAVNTLTDYRDFVDAETKTLMIPAVYSYNATDGTNHYYAYVATSAGASITLTDNKVQGTEAIFDIPTDLVDVNTLYAEAVLIPGVAAGNIYAAMQAAMGKCGESISRGFNSVGYAAETIGAAGNYTCHRQLALTNALPGDVCKLIFTRDSTNILDTCNGPMYFVAFKIEYLGWRVA